MAQMFWIESEFRDALARHQAGDDQAAADLYLLFGDLAAFVASDQRLHSRDLEDAIADGVARCFQYINGFDPNKGTGFNYFAMVVGSKLRDEAARAAKRCQILDSITSHKMDLSREPSARDALWRDTVRRAVDTLSGDCELVARAIMYADAPAVPMWRLAKFVGLPQSRARAALAEMRYHLAELAAEG